MTVAHLWWIGLAVVGDKNPYRIIGRYFENLIYGMMLKIKIGWFYLQRRGTKKQWATEELKIRISPEDKERIKLKMEDAGILNMSAYIRKMALDRICIRLNLKDVRQLTVMLRRCSDNLNQPPSGLTKPRASMRRTLKIYRTAWTRFGNCPDNLLPSLPLSDSGR